MLKIVMLPDFSKLKKAIRKEVHEEIEPYLKRLDTIEKKIDRLLAVLGPISSAINKIPFLKG